MLQLIVVAILKTTYKVEFISLVLLRRNGRKLTHSPHMERTSSPTHRKPVRNRKKTSDVYTFTY